MIAIIATIIGYIAADYLNKDMMIGLAVVNPIYFMCAMIGVMKRNSLSVAIISGAILGPTLYLISPQWSVLFAGIAAGTVAFFVGEKNGN